MYTSISNPQHPHGINSNPKAIDAGKFGELPEWDLSDLYPGTDSTELKEDIAKLHKEAVAFETKYKGKLSKLVSDGDAVAAAVREFESLEDLGGRLGAFAYLYYTGDVTDSKCQKFLNDMQEKLTVVRNHLLFFVLELNKIDDKLLEGSLQNPNLAHYKPWFDDIRKERPYQLEERLELLFHEKQVTTYNAWNRLFDETISQYRYQIDGEEMSIEGVLNLLQDPIREKRKVASEELAKSLKENISTYALITNTLAKDKEISDRWRGFEDIADSRHLMNRVERSVVDSLVETVRSNYSRLSHRYYKIKAKWLGLEKLAHWDRNAPLPDSDLRNIPWTKAKQIVLDAYRGFSPEMADIARKFFENGWIDAPVRTGKAQGAFSHPTVPSSHPYVMLNYLGRVRDVMVLAHELGHGVHQVLAAENGALMAPTPLTLAETASVFGEMLTFRSLIDTIESSDAKKVMLATKVEDMLNTVVRQISFYQFERQVHTERALGELTSDRIGEIWMEVQQECLGPSVELLEGYETFWAYVPHFIHSPFYVYAYAFGDCLVNALYSIYESAESGFQQKYFDLLRAGGTKHHSELLAPFGLDANDPRFWEKGLSVISNMIDEIELADK